MLISGTRTSLFIFILEFAYCPKVIKSGIRGFGFSEDCVCLKFYRRYCVYWCCFLFSLFFFLGLFSQVFFPRFLSIFALDQHMTPKTTLVVPPAPPPALNSGQDIRTEISSHPRVMSHKVWMIRRKGQGFTCLMGNHFVLQIPFLILHSLQMHSTTRPAEVSPPWRLQCYSLLYGRCFCTTFIPKGLELTFGTETCLIFFVCLFQVLIKFNR